MTDLMVSSKRPRGQSFADKHSESHADSAAAADWFREREVTSDQVKVRNFLEICRFCKKKLRHGENVFMYGHFGAFCSKECRAKQIACDIFTESTREIANAKKKGRTCGGIKPKESKDEEAFGGNQERVPSPRFYI